LQEKLEELRKAIGLFSEVLGKVVLGDMAARVDTKSLSEELGITGETINSIIESLEYYVKKSGEVKSKSKRKARGAKMIAKAKKTYNLFCILATILKRRRLIDGI
jgi:uncharacterized protein (DUF362 family)